VDLPRIAEELRARRDELTTELGAVTAVERDPNASVSFGKRIGEGTTEAVERLNRVGTARELGAMREDVERALEKIDDGTYGICDRCGRLIPEARLEARPWSVYCVGCAAIVAGRST
jgi:DnaK suppressor protein